MLGKADAHAGVDSAGAGARTVSLRHDPRLIDELKRANREAMMSYSVALHAGRRGSFDAAALAISRCARQLHDVQRTEALRLYPTIARRMANDPEGAAAVAALRRDANALVRHFMRLVEGLFSRARPGMPSEELIADARSVLQKYLAEKESRLYRVYALTAPPDGDARRT